MTHHLKYKTDFEKSVIINNLEKRGMTRCGNNDGLSSDSLIYSLDDWNFYWANVSMVKQMFNPEYGYRLSDNQ